MKVTLSIERFDPEKDSGPRMQEYHVEVEPTDRVLDALTEIQRNVDGTLALRKSCAHGVCGSDAMVINGKTRLACKTLVRDVAGSEGATIEIRPARHMARQRDLMVDQQDFFAELTLSGYRCESTPGKVETLSGGRFLVLGRNGVINLKKE